jgi:hypothetical protein
LWPHLLLIKKLFFVFFFIMLLFVRDFVRVLGRRTKYKNKGEV